MKLAAGALAALALAATVARPAPAIAAPEGQMTWGYHVTLAARWLDPAETEALLTPFMVLYAIHDAQRQERETDRKKRETMLFQIQRTLVERTMHIPIYELAFIWGVGPRVDEPGAGLIKGFTYSAPFEDLKLKAK